MTQAAMPNNLPVILAVLRQEALDGELVLEQNDGVRRLYWTRGELVYLQSDVAGEQFGNYLLRRGILDFPGLNRLLANDERFRLGEKVVQWGMMTVTDRDAHLQALQEQVMVNALEHPIVRLTWNPEPLNVKLSDDLHLQLDHRHFIWNTFKEAHNLQETLALLLGREDWTWEGIPGLLDTLADLPLTPATAYAVSFLGGEPISFATFLTLSDLPQEEAVRIFLSLWAVGALALPRNLLPVPAFGAGPADPSPDPPPPPAQVATESPAMPAAPAGPPVPQAAPPAPQPSPLERARSLYRKARKHHLQDRTGEAIHCLEQSVQLDPCSDAAYPVWLLLGRLRMANPAWSTRAIDALQSASRIRAKAADPWISMGEVYLRKGFRTNALACFRKALDLDPSVPIPPGVDLHDLEAQDAAPSPTPTSLLRRFKSILGGS